MSSTASHSVHPSAVIGQQPVRKPKRARISGQKRKRALDLEQRLRFLQDDFSEPEFHELLEGAIAAAHRISESNRNRDRDHVFLAIDEHGCRRIDEIMEETELSRWVTKGCLDELIQLELIEIRQGFDLEPEGDKPIIEYHPRHTPPGSNFFAPHPSPSRPSDDL